MTNIQRSVTSTKTKKKNCDNNKLTSREHIAVCGSRFLLRFREFFFRSCNYYISLQCCTRNFRHLSHHVYHSNVCDHRGGLLRQNPQKPNRRQQQKKIINNKIS